MVHPPPQLPGDWADQVGRAYMVFGVSRLLEPERTEFVSLGGFLRGARRYWTTEKLRAKEELQPEDPVTHRWRKRLLTLPGKKARADIGRGEVDELNLPEEEEGEPRPRFHSPEITPGLSGRNEAIQHEGKTVQPERGNPFRRDRIEPAPTAIPQAVLDRINEDRADQGLDPLMLPTGQWEGNGADLRNLSDEVVAEMLERLRVGKKTDPQAAGSLEEMTENIIDAFKAASTHELDYGEKWYAEAAEATLDLAEEFGVDPHVVAALVASTSPRTEWEGNLVAARVALSSLVPKFSPKVTEEFLDTRMTFDTDLKGEKLIPDENGVIHPPTGEDYILNREGIRDSFKKKHPREGEKFREVNPETGRLRDVWVDTESAEDYEQRITDTIMATLNATNPDGTPMQIYQIRDQKLRAALMDINNRVLAENQVLPEGFERRPGMGLQYPKISSDGHVQQDRLRGFAKILSGNHAAIDRLFGYDEVNPLQHHLPKGWSGLPEDHVDLYHRINETLGGHKTRSFYNNIITHGQSDFATVDVHALRAALLGKVATRSGVAVPDAEKLLGNPVFPSLPKLPKTATAEQKAERATENARRDALRQQWKDEKRVGVYAVVNEAFRLAAERINVERVAEGKLPLSPAQVQAVAWVASRPESVGSDFTNMAMQERDPGRAAARVLPHVPAGQRERAMGIIGKARDVGQARRNLAIAGIDPEVLPDDGAGAELFNRANAAVKPMPKEFVQLKTPGTMNLNAGQLATAAWLTNRFSDAEAAERMRDTFKDKHGNRPQFTPADAALVRGMMADRHSKGELLAGAGKGGIQGRLDAYNETRRAAGIKADPLTYDQFLKFLRTGDYE